MVHAVQTAPRRSSASVSASGNVSNPDAIGGANGERGGAAGTAGRLPGSEEHERRQEPWPRARCAPCRGAARRSPTLRRLAPRGCPLPRLRAIRAAPGQARSSSAPRRQAGYRPSAEKRGARAGRRSLWRTRGTGPPVVPSAPSAHPRLENGPRQRLQLRLSLRGGIRGAPRPVRLLQRRREARSGSRPMAHGADGGPATTFSTGSPAMNLATCARTSARARGKNAELLPPTCGDSSRPGADHRGMIRRQRFRVSNVERCEQPTADQLGQQRVGVDDRPTRDVHQQRAVAHRRQEARIDKPASGRRQGARSPRRCRRPAKARAALDAVHIGVRPGSACDPHNVRLEGQHSPFDGGADRAVSEYQHVLVGERGRSTCSHWCSC